MKSRYSALAILVATSLVATLFWTAPAAAQQDRKGQILENLKLSIPQLAEVGPTMGPIGPSGIDGLDEGTFVVQGRPYSFLVTADNKKLWLVQGEAMDVSRGEAEIKVAIAEREEEARKAAEARTAQLAASIEGRPFRGSADAAVTIIEFSDFQCPYCTRGAATVEEILERYPNDVKFVFQHFPLGFHPWAKPAAIAANCAGLQNPDAFWTLHDAYFKDQKQLTTDNVVAKSEGYLAGSGIDMKKWENCAADTNSAEYKAEAANVDADMALGQALGVTGTPGFFVNGEFLNGAQPIDAFVPLIEAAKANS
jgi:protein-disulfide isomerase